jgi:hypothetical protein
MNAPAATDMRAIPGFDGVYSACADGRIWAHARSWMRGGRSHAGRFLTPDIGRFGYHRVTLFIGGARRRHSVHRLVAMAWLPNDGCLPFVNHKDGVKANNGPANLEWCTQGDNERHAWRTGLKKDTPERKAIRAATMRSVNARGLAGKGARK